MTSWIQEQFADTDSPYVVAESAIANSYPVGLLTITSLAHNPRVQIIFIAEFEGKVLVGVPKSAWHRKTAQRVFTSWMSVQSYSHRDVCMWGGGSRNRDGWCDDSHVGRFTSRQRLFRKWIFCKSNSMRSTRFKPKGRSFVFLNAQALAEAANEHFSFSLLPMVFPDAAEVVNGHDEPGSADVSSRVSRLESYIEDMAQNMKQLMEAHQSGRIPVQTYGPEIFFCKIRQGCCSGPQLGSRL